MSEEEPPHRPTLDYQSPPRVIEEGNYTGQVVVGMLLTVVTVFIAVPAFIVLGSALSTATNRVLGPILACVAAGATLAAAIHATRDRPGSPDRSGWRLGFWIGLGLALLIEGLCFASFR